MLYYLLPPLASISYLGFPERHALHHVQDRGGQPDGARDQPGARGRGSIRKLRDFQIGQVIRRKVLSRTAPRPARPRWAGCSSSRQALVPSLLWADLSNPFIWIAMGATLGCGAVGFVDDYLKITRRSHHGSVAALQDARLLVGGRRVGVAVLMLSYQNPPLYNTRLIFPFFKNLIPDLGVGYVLFAFSCSCARPIA
jgi:phospho-N-acetylmuramoyl-pentapeptide-transferase